MYLKNAKKRVQEQASKQDIYVLGIETSCDETAAAVVKNGKVLSNQVFSQVDIHAKFGGVVPEVASRNHIYWIDKIVDLALKEAEIEPQELSCVGVTYGGGLIGSLLVGVSFAKGFCQTFGVPLIAINHTLAHIASGMLCEQLKPPFLALALSGGHTIVARADDFCNILVLAQTCDDAIGEAFDKVARVLGLPYPGGANLDKLAQQGTACMSFFKKPRKVDEDFVISYGGLKTAVINHLHGLKQKNEQFVPQDIAASFSKDAIDPLLEYALLQARLQNLSQVFVCGGVAANSYLRKRASQLFSAHDIECIFPPMWLCGDNAAMVAAMCYHSFTHKRTLCDLDLNAYSRLF